MRRQAGVMASLLSLLVATALHAPAAAAAPAVAPTPALAESIEKATTASEPELIVSAVSFGEVPSDGGDGGGDGGGGAALAALVCGALRARGVRARAAAAPAAACAAPDGRACLRWALGALARGALHVALVPAPRAPPAPRLRDAGLEELGDAAPPAHRACAAPPPARSLLELADGAVAAQYALSADDVRRALRTLPSDVRSEMVFQNMSEWNYTAEYATVLTTDEGEAEVLRAIIRQHGLRAHAVVAPAAARLPAALAPRAAVLCGRALDAAALAGVGARVLAPPPCLDAECPFEARRLIKLVNARVLARAPGALRVLARVALGADELRALEAAARGGGAERAAAGVLAAHPAWWRAAREVRVAVMIPATTRRETYCAGALRAAAELAETDEAAEAADAPALDFKVELVDDACSGPRAFKYLTDALGTEFGALSAVAGPACGAAFADVARQSGALALPVLAYSAQAPGGGAGAALALLAAGDARREARALAALLARLRWRRLALLSELGTRAALEPALLAPEVLAHVELAGDGERLDTHLIRQWAERAAAAHARVLYVRVEDARVARAALCAGRRAGLLPAAGAVWLLAGALPAGWLEPRPGDQAGCSRTELAEAAEGHVTAAPEWAARWAPAAAWAGRWRRRCERQERGVARGAACGAPPPDAGVLYDALRLWAGALRRLLRDHPTAIDDLHRDDLVRSLVEDAGRANYSGVTGAFSWAAADGARARLAPLVLRQWSNGTATVVGAWSEAGLALDERALRWATADGRAPDDGAPRCAVQALADALRADCRVAYAASAALPLAALAALLGAGAWRWRRRARREYRARLAALGMRALGAKPAARDRWELPRERVVINRKLGTGAFGTVYGGHALVSEERGWVAVAVKTLKAGASTEEKLDFLAEAEAMKRFEHENVVRLLGVVTASEPVCTVMEFMLYGDLKSFLLARRQLAGAGEVAPARLTRMARDVARALAYLARQRYVHRDVAARNCLVSAARAVKLADFGMARLVFEHDYYRFGRAGLLPVRWMAPEALALGVFSPASDVWALGVLLYEMATFGALPFQGLTNAQVLRRVKAGHALPLPPALRPQLAELIRRCMSRDKRQRPRAAAVAAQLAAAPRLLVPCLDVPFDVLPLHAADADADADADVACDVANARWTSCAAPGSAATDSTYLSAEPPRDTDAFLPPHS